MFELLSEKFSSLFSRMTGKGAVSESQIAEVIETVRTSLLEADVPYEVVTVFVQELKQEVVGQKLTKSLKPDELLMKIMYDKIVAFLGASSADTWNPAIPSTIMVMGLQGSGKTTTVAKLASYLKAQAEKRGKKRKIILASVDYYRPAAREQLAVNARLAGVDYYEARATNPVAATDEIMQYVREQGYEYLFLDTAGRLHVDQELLHELELVHARVKPKYNFLVVDAMTGQESLAVARAFDRVCPFHNVILTKMDSDTRGGAAFAFKYLLKKDILFVGVGEKLADFEPFRPQRIASRMIGMGDMMTLVERAQEKIKESESERMYKALKDGRLTLDDFAQQLEMMGRMGSLSSLMKMMPGMGASLSDRDLEKGEVELKRFKAIMSSMTKKERLNPVVLDLSRKQRIARGSGVAVSEVNLLLERFEQTQQFAKIFKKMGRLNPFFK